MGDEALQKKAHLVKWEVICSKKREGSLSLRILSLELSPPRQMDLEIFSESDCIWKRLICSKFGCDDLG